MPQLEPIMTHKDILPITDRLFVCLEIFVPLHSRIIHLFRDVTIAGKGLQILTYARHLWPLTSEVSLAYMYHTKCDTGHPFIIVISEDP